jgi:hypothetical protein
LFERASTRGIELSIQANILQYADFSVIINWLAIYYKPFTIKKETGETLKISASKSRKVVDKSVP